ncbi:hypothetical protein NSK11_contig00118-0007 [Nocardia seriolae]|uniref:Uncharacterized protein n=1 Tax=Nocardia seriolae TaxID=37332 RepID=A0ABC9Z1F0_9NOCA|nr:hypothetical protein NSERKGN1266_38830 [Nocardia seriolae]BEK96583.1 hypothetical protein NSER024013_44890 [Nocardia seriolae]GAM49557.1 hypothetical protein NS07_v2contig00112-0007 [Nocardia seriolae]GAP31543.1 hypothetical protein NSK11_contig00118-0007 [Nocardia seriolae]GEM27213.1 hypothetical protein NS2_54520 [Nocardia seriolae NBRC 15557]
MTRKKAIGLLVGVFVCATVFTLNPSAAWGSGEIGAPPAAPGATPRASTPAGGGGVPPAPERIVPVPPPSGGFLCPTP